MSRESQARHFSPSSGPSGLPHFSRSLKPVKCLWPISSLGWCERRWDWEGTLAAHSAPAAMTGWEGRRWCLICFSPTGLGPRSSPVLSGQEKKWKNVKLQGNTSFTLLSVLSFNTCPKWPPLPVIIKAHPSVSEPSRL